MTTILIIEDELELRLNIAQVLMYEGYEILEAPNGLVGVQLAHEYSPDLIVCDVMMPELNGHEVLTQLQADPATATIPFIFSTARADRDSIRYGMRLGADDYLTKPYTNDELVATIQTRLAKHQNSTETFTKLSSALDNQTLPQIPMSAAPQSLIGMTVRGYQISTKIGEGGSGTVYKAYQPAIGRDVAIKVLSPKYADNIEFVRRFQTEAELVARLEHPHIIPLYDYWYDSSGIYIVMRWLRGGSLRTILDQRGSWTLERTANLLDQVANGLSIAHSVGIIHRDLKPDNILLDDYGNAYLTDFGLAKNLASGGNAALSEEELYALLAAQEDFFKQEPNTTLYLTDIEHLAGTPAYLSPEQIRFDVLSPQTDIYSLGITLYEMLMDQLPFSGTIGEMVVKHLQEEVPPIHQCRPHIPQGIDAVIQRATAKDAHSRYADVLTLARDFRLACGDPA